MAKDIEKQRVVMKESNNYPDFISDEDWAKQNPVQQKPASSSSYPDFISDADWAAQNSQQNPPIQQPQQNIPAGIPTRNPAARELSPWENFQQNARVSFHPGEEFAGLKEGGRRAISGFNQIGMYPDALLASAVGLFSPEKAAAIRNRLKESQKVDLAADEKFNREHPGSEAQTGALVGELIPNLLIGSKGASMLGKIPGAAGKFLGRNIPQQAATGAISGGISYGPEDSPLKKSVIGGTIGTGIGAGGALANAAIAKPLARAYAHSAIPGFIERATKKMRELPMPEKGAKAFQQKYLKAAEENAGNWLQTEKFANTLDTELKNSGKAFDSSPYIKHIDEYLTKVGEYSPAKKADYQEAIAFAQEAKNMAPTNFEDVTLLRQNFNSRLSDFLKKRGIDKEDRNAKSFVADLKKNLIGDTLKANKANVNPQSYEKFTQEWEKANKSHQKQLDFMQAPAKSGNIKPKQVLREGLKQKGAPDAAIIGEFIPTAKQTGISGFKQLEKNLGSKEETRKALQSYYFRNPLQNGATTQDVAGLFGKLSPRQRDYILGSTEEGKLLSTIDQVRRKLGKEAKHTGLITHGLGLGIPGLVGTGLGMAEGLPWDEALGVGAGAAGIGGLAAHAIGKRASPASIRRAVRIAKKGSKINGKLLNLGAQAGLQISRNNE